MENLEKIDYEEPACCFDFSTHTISSDTSDSPLGTIPVKEIINQLDALYASDNGVEAGKLLTKWLSEARKLGDWSGELSLLNEETGYFRRTNEVERGLCAIEKCLALIDSHNIKNTISGATIMLNSATTLKSFGKAKESLPLFVEVCRIFSSLLDPTDYRFAGLYNNMALSYCDVGEYTMSEEYFKKALNVLTHCPNSQNEIAVTWCNMAQLYSLVSPDDPRVDEAMVNAWTMLDDPDITQDGYYAFNISKCAPAFRRFGFPMLADDLEERAKSIYERNRACQRTL